MIMQIHVLSTFDKDLYMTMCVSMGDMNVDYTQTQPGPIYGQSMRAHVCVIPCPGSTGGAES